MRLLLRAGLFAAAVLSASAAPALAQGEDAPAALALFEEGRRLVAAGKVAEACPKFQESARLVPKVSTLLNLADCFERTGLVASAWARYMEAAALAKQVGQADRETFARDKGAALEPRLPKLTIAVTSAPAGLVVTRDGVEARAAVLGTPLPVDPGEHVVVASAPGKKSWSSKVSVAPASTATVTVPALEDDVEPAPAVPPPPAPVESPPTTAHEEPSSAPARRSPMRTIGVVTGAAGIVGVGVGAVFGALAASKKGQAESSGCTGNVCTPSAASTRDDARSDANVATVAFAAGGVLLAAGVTMWLLAPREGARAAVVPVAGPGMAGVGVSGAF